SRGQRPGALGTAAPPRPRTLLALDDRPTGDRLLPSGRRGVLWQRRSNRMATGRPRKRIALAMRTGVCPGSRVHPGRVRSRGGRALGRGTGRGSLGNRTVRPQGRLEIESLPVGRGRNAGRVPTRLAFRDRFRHRFARALKACYFRELTDALVPARGSTSSAGRIDSSAFSHFSPGFSFHSAGASIFQVNWAAASPLLGER